MNATCCDSCRITYVLPRVTCKQCGRKTRVISSGTARVSSEATEEGKRKVAICRSNQCGHYDADCDACKLVIEIGLRKGQQRAGKIAWLLANPGASCPDERGYF